MDTLRPCTNEYIQPQLHSASTHPNMNVPRAFAWKMRKYSLRDHCFKISQRQDLPAFWLGLSVFCKGYHFLSIFFLLVHWDKSGTKLPRWLINLPPGSHLFRFLKQILPEAEEMLIKFKWCLYYLQLITLPADPVPFYLMCMEETWLL